MVALVTAATVGPAAAGLRRGDTWSEIARTDEDEVAQREYDRAMLDGDQNVDMAAAEGAQSRRRKYVERAVLAYETAARARPSEAEPHFRAAMVLRAFYFDCDPGAAAALCRTPPSPSQVARVLEHFDAFAALAPLDPRLTEEILFERAIMRTKLATPTDLVMARRDYETILAHRGRSPRDAVIMGNLAETQMMLGDLDAAIETYRRTLELSNDLSHDFGLAVALDRDEQGQEARTILRSRGPRAAHMLLDRIRRGRVFYVPDGEKYYYLALGFEAGGFDDEAVELYQMFIDSGAHPQFAERARANRDALLRRRSHDAHRGHGPRWEPLW